MYPIQYFQTKYYEVLFIYGAKKKKENDTWYVKFDFIWKRSVQMNTMKPDSMFLLLVLAVDELSKRKIR